MKSMWERRRTKEEDLEPRSLVQSRRSEKLFHDGLSGLQLSQRARHWWLLLAAVIAFHLILVLAFCLFLSEPLMAEVHLQHVV